MARKNARGLELTFHRDNVRGGRWMKRGREFPDEYMYFGAGRDWDDKASYKAALAAYKAWKEEHAQAGMKAQIWETAYAVLKGVISGMKPEQVQEALAGSTAEGGRQTLVAGVAARPLVQMRGEPAKSGTTVADLLEEFDKENERRNHQRHRNDELRAKGVEVREKKNQCLSDERLATVRRLQATFKESFGTMAWDGKEATGARLLKKWRDECDDLYAMKKIGPATYDQRMAYGLMFANWAWTNHHLDSLPRNVKVLTAKYNVVTEQAKAVQAGHLMKLWAKASDRMKAWMALGLNCGLYAADVASLTGDMLRGDYLDFWRIKTGRKVNVKYRLWDVTRRLIERTRMDGEGQPLLWVTRKGKPLVHFNRKSAKRGKTSSIVPKFRRLGVKAGLAGKYNFTHLRDTGATAVEKIAPELTDLFLAHRDARMAKCYVDGKMVDTSALDAVLEKMEAQFALTLSPVKAKRKMPRRAA